MDATNYYKGCWKCSFQFLGLPNECIIIVAEDIRISFPQMSIYNVKCELISQGDKGLIFKVFGVINYGLIEILNSREGIYTAPDTYTKQVLRFSHYEIKDRITMLEQYGPDSNLKQLYNRLCKTYFTSDNNGLKIVQHYPDWDNPLCKEVRDRISFNLKGKSEIQRVSHIIRWINHYFIPGSMVEIPSDCSAIFYLKHPKLPMNCRTYSIIANDLLNSWGFRTRAIHCHPENEYDIESHFINEVYLHEMNKWILVDAAFGCMIRDDITFLNTKEVRDRIIENKQMHLFATQMNKKSGVDAKSYWEMIVKDFYYFTFYLDYSIGYNSFTNNEVLVLPIGYQTQKYLNKPTTNNIDQFYK